MWNRINQIKAIDGIEAVNQPAKDETEDTMSKRANVEHTTKDKRHRDRKEPHHDWTTKIKRNELIHIRAHFVKIGEVPMNFVPNVSVLQSKPQTTFHQSQLTEAYKNNEFVVIVKFFRFLSISIDPTKYVNVTHKHAVNSIHVAKRQQFANKTPKSVVVSFIISIAAIATASDTFVVFVDLSTFHVCVFSIRISLNLLRVSDALHKDLRQNNSSSSSSNSSSFQIHWCHSLKWWAMQWAVDTWLKRMTYTYKHIHLMHGDLN